MKRFLLLLVVLLWTHTATAQRTIPLNIEQLVRDAGTIIDGTVTGTRTGKDPESGLLVTWVTMNVNESFHGAVNGTITFKQYGGEADGLANYPKHLPRYAQGERSILFLTAPSSIGMQSPVGMQQGKFMIVQEGTAKTVVRNLTKNPSLFTGLTVGKSLAKRAPASLEEDGTMDVEEFTSLVRSYVQLIKR
ncbi:MAG: hypothetical protein HUU02_03405 [Bacteroidetes bacterium]|nr:hypothetical protein [Bacteroidota bacterium]